MRATGGHPRRRELQERALRDATILRPAVARTAGSYNSRNARPAGGWHAACNGRTGNRSSGEAKMNRAIILMAGVALAAGAAQAQEQEQDPNEEQGNVTERLNESVRTERDRAPPPEPRRQYEPREEFKEPYDKERKLRPPRIGDQDDQRARDRARRADESYGTGVGEQRSPTGVQRPPTGVAPASTATLPGKTIVTADGEEVGTIEQVGYSREHNERVATVDVGGFLGAGDKVIAIPISELGLGGESDLVTTSLDRTALEQEQEFNPSQLITAE